jgi:hypothetical protein
VYKTLYGGSPPNASSQSPDAATYGLFTNQTVNKANFINVLNSGMDKAQNRSCRINKPFALPTPSRGELKEREIKLELSPLEEVKA